MSEAKVWMIPVQNTFQRCGKGKGTAETYFDAVQLQEVQIDPKLEHPFRAGFYFCAVYEVRLPGQSAQLVKEPGHLRLDPLRAGGRVRNLAMVE